MGDKDHIHGSESRKVSAIGVLLRYGVPLVITVGLCYLLFHDLDLHEMWTTVRTDCDFRWIAGNIALNILAHVVRAARWRIQLRALGVKVSLWVVTLSIFGTYAVNLVFPRLGEIWRTGFISQRQKASFTEVFGSMVAERLSDTVIVALLTLVTFVVAGTELTAYLGQNPQMLEKITAIVSSPWVWIGLAVCMLLCVWIWFRFPDNRIVMTVRRALGGLWEGFTSIFTMPGKGRWLALTAVLWTTYFCGLWCAFLSFPVTEQVIRVHGMSALLVCYVLTSLSMGVPSNGGIGPWQWAMIFGLGFYTAGVPGLTYTYMATFANLVMGVMTLTIISLGILTFVSIAATKRNRNETD